MYEHVIWDWNGTLWDDLPQVHESVNCALGSIGGPTVTLGEYRALFERPVSLFYRKVMKRQLTSAEWNRVRDVFEVEYENRAGGARLAGDAHAALETARAAGLTQSVLSLYPHRFLAPLVHELGMASFFVAVEGLRGPSGGTKSGMLGGHLRSVVPDMDRRRVVLIGDTVDDMRAAAAYGLGGVYVDHHSPGANPDGELLDALRNADIRPVGQAGGSR